MLLILVSAGIAVLLLYYRPTIEYAYVDILDMREGPSRSLPAWALVGAPLTAAAIALLAYRRLRRREPR